MSDRKPVTDSRPPSPPSLVLLTRGEVECLSGWWLTSPFNGESQGCFFFFFWGGRDSTTLIATISSGSSVSNGLTILPREQYQLNPLPNHCPATLNQFILQRTLYVACWYHMHTNYTARPRYVIKTKWRRSSASCVCRETNGVLYFSISILCYFILPLIYISQGKIVLFTPQHLSNSHGGIMRQRAPTFSGGFLLNTFIIPWASHGFM